MRHEKIIFHGSYFKYRLISLSVSLDLMDSLLSYSFLPLPKPISTFTKCLSLKNIFNGTSVRPFSFNAACIRLSSLLVSSSFLSCTAIWLLAVPCEYSAIYTPLNQSSPLSNRQKASLKLTLPSRIDFTSVPNKTMPATYLVSMW